jgi:hypothetical protein
MLWQYWPKKRRQEFQALTEKLNGLPPLRNQEGDAKPVSEVRTRLRTFMQV